ncbi:MAG: TlpA family protein disulfide reductase, partial [Akkermansiaceae bacterium]|nr:TlpA family protein disulfide reductase [Akkermansiaceae bacterium]
SVRLGAGKPVLLNLWASWCAPCLVELGGLRDREGEIREAGIEVVALSVDGLGDERGNRAAASAALEKLNFPFVAV